MRVGGPDHRPTGRRYAEQPERATVLRVTEQDEPTGPAGQDGEQREPRVVRRRVRRAPDFRRFMITGAIVGLIVGVIIANSGPDSQGYSSRTGAALIGGVLAAFGALAGAIVALILERLLNRR